MYDHYLIHYIQFLLDLILDMKQLILVQHQLTNVIMKFITLQLRLKLNFSIPVVIPLSTMTASVL